MGARDLHTLSGHTDEVLDVVFDNVGRQVASAGADNTVRLWDVKDFSKPVHIFKGHEAEVSKVSYIDFIYNW